MPATPRLDAWLSDVLGYPAYRSDASGGAPAGDERSLTYAKVEAGNPEAVGLLEEVGFKVVDVNVTLEHDGRDAPISSQEIVDAVPEHGNALVDIAGRCFRYSRFHLDPQIPDCVANRVKAEWIRNYTTQQRGIELLTAVENDTPVGFLAVLADGDTRVIDLVGVAPEAQGRGWGGALVAEFIARHRKADRPLQVGTQIANVPSLRLYQGLGFRIASAAYVLHLHRGA